MIKLWTDGSCAPKNPGPGGWAVLREREDGGFQLVNLGAENPSTNIKMEGAAFRAALKYIIAKGEPAEIHTDSQFWVNALTKWAPRWEENDWTKAGGREIENVELVQELLELYRAAEVELIFGYGHKGVEGNELADKWANRARKGMTMEKIKEAMQ